MRIWFNRGFSLAAIARAMTEGNTGLEVIHSVRPGHSDALNHRHVWVEPDGDDETYLEWVRRQIIEHAIDVFVPTGRRSLFADNAMPCHVHLPASSANLAVLEDKLAFAHGVADQPFHLATQGAESCAELRAKLSDFGRDRPGQTPCVKPRKGVNGHGFWTLTQGSALTHIMDPDRREMRADIFLAAIEAVERTATMPPMVLMEFLPGPEVSIDVLAHEGRILKYVARTKHGRRQHLQGIHPLEDFARILVSRFHLHGLVSIQFRKDQSGNWKVLEINARPAGGSIYAERFGARLIADWGGLLAGSLLPEAIRPLALDIEIEMATTPAPVPEGPRT